MDGRRLVLRVSLPYPFTIRACERLKFVGLQSEMTDVNFEQTPRLQDLLVQISI